MPGGPATDYGDLLVGRLAQYWQSTPIPHLEWRFWNYEGVRPGLVEGPALT